MKVLIIAEETVKYHQVLNMTQEQYDTLMQKWENGDSDAVLDWVDRRYVESSRNPDVIDVMEIKEVD